VWELIKIAIFILGALATNLFIIALIGDILKRGGL
jgi:hypothetical protein